MINFYQTINNKPRVSMSRKKKQYNDMFRTIPDRQLSMRGNKKFFKNNCNLNYLSIVYKLNDILALN